MEIHRRIERRLEVSADEVYAALAAKYDLPVLPTSAHVQLSKDTIVTYITLVAVHQYDTEVAE